MTIYYISKKDVKEEVKKLTYKLYNEKSIVEFTIEDIGGTDQVKVTTK